MKKILLTVVACVALTAMADARTLSLVEDPWPPFTFGKAGAPPTGGYAVEFAEAIFGRLGVEFEITLFPWKRCLHMVEHGISDGLLLATRNVERETWLSYTDPIMESRDLVWYRADRPSPIEWTELKDFKPYVIGRSAGFNYGDAFNAAEARYGFNIEENVNDLLNFKKLAAGRIDIFICNEIAAKYIFESHPELQGLFAASEKPLKTVTLYMGFSRKSGADAIVPEVNKAISELKAEGVFNAILSK